MIKALVVVSLLAAGLAQEMGRSPLVYSGHPQYGHYYPHHGYNYYPYFSSSYPAHTYRYVSAPVQPYKQVSAPQAISYAPVQDISYAPVQAVSYTPAPAPYTVGSQFHAQDEFGNLNYGYSNVNSMKEEAGNTYGGVQGAYSYVDPNGELQRVEYVADALGFRVSDSRLPVAPVYDGVAPTFNPEPLVAPEDTEEVKAAKAAHMAALEAAALAAGERKKREAEPGFAYGFNSLHVEPQYFRGLPHIFAGPSFYHHGLPYYG